MQAHVAGATTDPTPLTTELTFTCPASDGGANDDMMGEDPVGDSTAQPNAGGGGCSAARAPRGERREDLAAWLLVAVGVVLRARRRARAGS